MRKLLSITAMLLVVFAASSFVPAGYSVGDKAMDFKLKNIDGKMVSLADFKDAKGFIVIFTCNHCPYAKAYEDRIIALDKRYKSQGYPVIAVNPNGTTIPDDSYDNMKTRAQEKGFTYPYLYDESQVVAKSYGAAHTPHVFVLQKENGNLVVKYIGAIDDNTDDASAATHHYVEEAVNALLSGGKVAIPQTKAIGCTIKWKA
jgi:peroxiredoxin